MTSRMDLPDMHTLNVITTLNPKHGGPMEGVRQYALALRKMGNDLTVLTLDHPDDPWIKDFPAQVHAIGPVHFKYAYSPRLIPWLKQHAGEYDAVIVHGLWQYHGLAVRRALRGTRTPYYVFCHGMLDPWFKRAYPLKHLKKWLYWPWAEYRVLRDARAVLFTTEEEMLLAPQSFWLYRTNAVVAGYGLSVEGAVREGQQQHFYEIFPELRNKRLLLFLSRIHPKKGCDLLIEAFGRMAQQPELHLVMAGPDPSGMRAQLEALAVKAGVADRITWTGMISGDLKWGALRAAEAFILPSHQENFGIAVAEALAVGTPVLISKQVNIWREIVASHAGFAEADSVDGTTRLLQRWLALDETERRAMGENARDCFQKHFHIDAAAVRFVELIQRFGKTGTPARHAVESGLDLSCKRPS